MIALLTHAAFQVQKRINCGGVIGPKRPFADWQEIARDLLGFLEMSRLIQGNLVALQRLQRIGMFRAQELLPALPHLSKERSCSFIFMDEVFEKGSQPEFCVQG